MSNSPTVSVIIPAHNAGNTLPLTLRALRAAIPPPAEILVVDDGSQDETRSLAEALGARVVRLDRNVGAASAKNRGAQAARGDLLFFTDADIVPPADTIRKLVQAIQSGAADGAIGLLDENIPAQNWASQFKNLWMNFTYGRLAQSARVGLFYTSAAAMRRDTFTQLGGFDENYRGASIAEDTEFGQRAWSKGCKIVLAPNLRVVHLKAYSPSSVLREDFRRARALMLMRLRKWGQPFYTSVPLFYQLAVPTIYLALLLLLGSVLLGNNIFLVGVLLALFAFYALNASFLGFLISKRGIGFGLMSALFLPLDVLVVGAGMLAATLDFARGIRY